MNQERKDSLVREMQIIREELLCRLNKEDIILDYAKDVLNFLSKIEVK